ncbi:phosphonoacetaldehyde hydrolase [Vreelandella massiliensis]|uniref:phosphonoacetaldehyde hydrolase n=1 Tax=Vreelandella massiliensis TaxID=1816686 RepID=UPI00096A8E48|nr:phosphonoacetaldehyde hydrolase [Halomonas massiliensis]
MHYQTPQQLEAAIFDWAGTLVDFGSFAPTQIFVEAFAEMGVVISLEEARGPMGMGKWDHIRALCNEPAIAKRFFQVVGRAPSDDDVTALYERFMPLQIEKIAEHSALIPGVLDVLEALRGKGMQLGSCSGYPAVVLEKVVALAKQGGVQLDHVVATDQVPNGRPNPAQSLANVIALGIRDVAACVKVDDTAPGIVEGRSAGMWTVALTCSGNALGVDYATYRAMPKSERTEAHQRIAGQFSASQPHFCIKTIEQLPRVIDEINVRMANGDRP